MTFALTLVTLLGKPLADGLIERLTQQKNGAEKLEQAANLVTKGMTAVEALRKSFGKGFLHGLNESLNEANKSDLSYEGNTQSYIRLEYDNSISFKTLRDELNINLDRLTLSKIGAIDTRNQFKGLMSVWQNRCRQFYDTNIRNNIESETENAIKNDVDSTFAIIQDLLEDKCANYRQIFELLSRTSLGGTGALMVIIGASIATGTGVGVVATFSMLLFGIPWLSVGVLVLPGVLLMVLASLKTQSTNQISVSVSLAYKLLERIEEKSKSSSSQIH